MKIKRFLIAGTIIFAIGLIILLFVIFQPGFAYNSSQLIEKVDKYDEILNIDYCGDAEGLVIEYSQDTNEVITYNSDNMWYDVSYNETTKTVVIKQQTKPIIFSIGYSRANKPVVIRVNAELTNVDVEVDAGDVSFSDISIKNLKVVVDAGKVSFSNCIVEDANIEIDAGAVEYTGKITNQFICNIDVGSVTLNLNQKQNEFKVNGSGQGSIIINISIDVGSQDIKYLNE